MSRIYRFFLFLAALALLGCNIRDNVYTHKFEPDYVTSNDVRSSSRILADIDNDNIDEIVVIEKYSDETDAIVSYDQKGKVLAQINLPAPVRHISSLKDPRDDRVWLYYTFNDGERVYLHASSYTWRPRATREDKRFESIERVYSDQENPNTAWDGIIYPHSIVDLDGDGKLELVCLGSAGFKANPRGIIVYDLDTGALKWQYRMPSVVRSLIIEDLNSDGELELLFSTIALKNSLESINGVDDLNSYIGVLDANGKSLFQEQSMRGYSSTNLAIADADQDGETEIYSYIHTWGSLDLKNSISILRFRNNRLVKAREYAVASTFQTMDPKSLLHTIDRDQLVRLTFIDASEGLIVLDDKLEKVQHKFVGWPKHVWEAVDLDKDGDLEFLLQTDDDYFVVLDNTFRIRARIKNPYPGEEGVRFSSINRGFAKDRVLLISSPLQYSYYHYHPVPINQLLLNLIRAYSATLLAISVLLTLYILFLYIRRKKMYYLISNSVEFCHIVTKGTDRILYLNTKVEELLALSGEQVDKERRRSLRKLFPELSAGLESFTQTKNKTLRVQSVITLGDAGRQYTINYIDPGEFPKLYMIVFYPVNADDGVYHRQMLWAETARRLSHNVRRHITNVILALEPLERRNEHAVDIDEYLSIIKDETERIRIFTHAFQRFTELKDYDLKRQDIIPSLEHCLGRIKMPDKVHLIKDWSLSSVEAMIEPIRFEEALLNLITNALDAMSKGGTLHITVKRFPTHGGPHSNLPVLVEIADTGIGIPPQNMQDIWKPFYTMKESGTGIGLPESKKIIESMHGILELESEQGTGTTVSIWLKAKL